MAEIATAGTTGEAQEKRNFFFIMPKAKPIPSLSGMVDTDMEDDTLNMEADAFPTPDSNQENAQAKKKGGRGKATSKRFTKPKTALRRVSGDSIVSKKVAPKKTSVKKRAPLTEQMNVQQAEDTEEVDDFAENKEEEDVVMDETVQPKQAGKRKVPEKKAGRPPKKSAVEEVSGMVKDGEFEYTPTAVRTKGMKKPSAAQARKANTSKSQICVDPQQQERIIPETQVPVNVEPSELPDEEELDEEAVPQSEFRRTNNARNNNYQPHPVARRRAGSASDTERGGNDPFLRRKLGEMTKRFEKLELKYRNLREVGIKDAEANFEKYKAQTQVKSKGMFSCGPRRDPLLTAFSRGRPNSLPPKRDSHPKVTLTRHSLPAEANDNP